MKLTPVTYVGSHDEVEVPVVGVVCQHGASIEVPAAIAASLLEQTDNWQPSKKRATQPASEPAPAEDSRGASQAPDGPA